MKYILLLILFLGSAPAIAQVKGFAFGQATYRELEMQVYDKDTSANALILNEFGEAHFENSNNYNLIFDYHVKIKILKQAGLSVSDFEIPLRISGDRVERLLSVKASSFNVENGSMREVALDKKNVFTENRNKYFDVKKFAIPNVRVGSVIEVQYVIESPFIYNFRTWDFQAEWPKVNSEFWASIPANYIYNMTLRGFLKLDKNENSVVPRCFEIGGGHADCALYKFAMKDIPAFVEEDYITAKSNFLSSVNFELSEIRYFDGRVDKITKEWKDVEEELKNDEKFGKQLRRGEDIMDANIDALISGEVDPLVKAKKIYDFIKGWYHWNDVTWAFSEFGIKKAFASKKGNVGDINLSLIAALKYAGLSVEPVILSTRKHGLPTELHPVISDFNYVIAKVNIGDKVYLADATEDFYPFGLLPERCLNGKGRVLGEDQSYWIDLKPAQKAKQINILNLQMDQEGMMRGTLQTTFTGYEAVSARKKIFGFANTEDYINYLKTKFSGVDITHYELKELEVIENPLIQKLHIEIPTFAPGQSTFVFQPFLRRQWIENPFKSQERLYPVDFGNTIEEINMINIQFPDNVEVVSLPEKTGVALPNAGGRFIVESNVTGNLLTISTSFSLTKTVYSAEEYHYLKELFNKMLQAQNTDLLLKRKK